MVFEGDGAIIGKIGAIHLGRDPETVTAVKTEIGGGGNAGVGSDLVEDVFRVFESVTDDPGADIGKDDNLDRTGVAWLSCAATSLAFC